LTLFVFFFAFIEVTSVSQLRRMHR